jgi:hypothetical protein
MDANLTISTLAFTQQYSDKTGSLRREVSRGLNLPETMQIKHQTYTDSVTKRPGTQSALIFEYAKALADGTIAVVARATLKVQSLTDTAVTSTEILAVLERVINTIQEDDTGLDLGNEIFVNKEQ